MKRYTMNTRFLITAVAALTLACTGCGHKAGDGHGHDGHDGEETHEHHDDQDIVLSDSQLKTVDITLGKIERREMGSVARVSGRTALNPQYQASVSSLVGGIIRSVSVIEGNRVSRGQTVAYIENTDIVALQKDYLTSITEALAAEQEHSRQKELIRAGAGVQKTLQQATAACRVARAQVLGLERQLRQLGISPARVAKGNITTRIPVKAPISGYVDKIRVPVGGYADMQTPIMDIVDNANLHCDLSVFENDIPSLRVGQQVDLTLTNRPAEKIKGVVYEIGSSFEGTTKSVKVHVRITQKNPDLKLIPDMYLTGLVHIGRQRVEALPSDAIVSDDGHHYIFMLEKREGKDYHFSRREVKTGTTEDGFTQVVPVAELPANATVVRSNAFYLSSALKGDEGGHGH